MTWLNHLVKLVVNTHVFDDYLLIEKLGEGGFASVYRAKELCTGDNYAIKSISKTTLIENEAT
jgi:serine/threonine protein kinase